MAEVIVLGGGISGLACAAVLARAGVSVHLYERNNYLGGRASTEVVDGFLFDRGFQVFLESYDEFPALLDLSALKLAHYRSGAFIQDKEGLYQFVNPLHEPWALLNGLFSPWATFRDKVRLAGLLAQALRVSADKLPTMDVGDLSALAFLQGHNIQPRTLHRFFQPFFGDVFLDRDLQEPASLLLYLLRLFAFTKASLPAAGMGALASQLASGLPPGTISLSTEVSDLNGNYYIDGQQLKADYIVVAGDFTNATIAQGRAWHATTTLYYEVPKPQVKMRSLFLNVSGGPILNLSFITEVQPAYAPKGKSLLSVTLQPDVPMQEADKLCKAQLKTWFGPSVEDYRYIKGYQIPRALPSFGQHHPIKAPYFKAEGQVVFCGDYLAYPSLNGAAASGRQAAEHIIASLHA